MRAWREVCGHGGPWDGPTLAAGRDGTPPTAGQGFCVMRRAEAPVRRATVRETPVRAPVTLLTRPQSTRRGGQAGERAYGNRPLKPRVTDRSPRITAMGTPTLKGALVTRRPF